MLAVTTTKIHLLVFVSSNLLGPSSFFLCSFGTLAKIGPNDCILDGCTTAQRDGRAGELGCKVVRGDCPLEGCKEDGHNINNKTELVLRWGEPMARDDAVFSGVQFSTFSPMILQGQSRRKKKNKQKGEGKKVKQIIERIG